MDAELLITGGRIVAETAVLPRGYVLVRAGRIASIGAGDPQASSAGAAGPVETVDATGLTVLPGLIDMHTHGIGDVDFMEADVEGMLRALRRYARFGVTGVVGTTLSNPIANIVRQAALMRKAREDREIGGLLLGTHVEGPWLAPRCRGGHAAEYLCAPVAADVDRLLGEVGDVIRTVTYAPELPGSVESDGAPGRSGASCPCSVTPRRPSSRQRPRSSRVRGTSPTCTIPRSATTRTPTRRS